MTTVANYLKTVNFSLAVSVVAKIKPDSPKPELFELEGGTVLARVLPVEDGEGRFVDSVAYADDDPHTWYLQRDKGIFLGIRQLMGASGISVPIFPTPESWFQGHGWGICIINWRVKLLPFLEGVTLDTGHLDPRVADIMEKRLESNCRRDFPIISRMREPLHAA
ncbi:MAG: hypothetical protein GEU76_03910 [Alphaproteobacteria bacterium]|nr:hypothetical protein [Alphaproteobacteria bacterium]